MADRENVTIEACPLCGEKHEYWLDVASYDIRRLRRETRKAYPKSIPPFTLMLHCGAKDQDYQIALRSLVESVVPNYKKSTQANALLLMRR